MEIVIGLIIGLAVGLVVVALARREISPLREDAARLRRELDAVRPDIEAHRLARATAETQLEERSSRIAEVEGERDDARAQLAQRIEQELTYQTQLSERETSLQSIRAQAATLTSERDQARTQRDDLQQHLAETQARLSESDTSLQSIREQAATLTGERDQARTQRDELQHQLSETQARLSESDTSLQSIQKQAETLTTERDQARTQRDELQQRFAETQARLSESDTSLQAIRSQAQTLTTERDQARTQLDRLQEQLSAAQVELSGLTADHAARQEELESYRNELEARFKGIAADVTESTRNEFIKEFRDLSKQQSEASIELVGNTVKPLRESLAKLDQGAQAMEKTRENAYADLRRSLLQSNQAIGELRQEASGLRQALRSPQVRGLWGEQQLQNVLEASGLREHVDFGQQVDSGGGRPDVVVHIPGQRSVIIDAKTPLDSYLSALEAEDQGAERSLLNAHANSLFNHSRSLGQKDYARQIDDALDFVILFVPSDAILDAALRVRPELFEQAWRQHRVLMAAPGSLIAFLRAVAQVWQQQTIQQNAVEIASAAHELYERLGTYTEHLDRMGRSLGQAVNHYNRGVGSFQSRVLSSARKIEELSEIEESRRIDEPSPLEADVREVTAPELDRASAPPSIDDAADINEDTVEDITEDIVEDAAEAVMGDIVEDIVGETYAEPSSVNRRSIAELSTQSADAQTHRRSRSRARTPRPVGFSLWGERSSARGFRGVLQGVAGKLYLRHRNDFARAMEIRGRSRQYITRFQEDHVMPLPILDSPYWMEGNHSGANAITMCHRLLEHFGHQEQDLIIHYPD